MDKTQEEFLKLAIGFAGILGVVIGAVLTMAKELWFQNKKDRKEAQYLAIQITCMLDRYVAGCAAVATDDGQANIEGHYTSQIDTPSFEPDATKVEWKSLPAGLMYEILSFPNKINIADSHIRWESENSFPPYFSEYFQERRFQYATLGIAAAVLADKLRTHAKLPNKETNDWNPVKSMQEQKSEILTARATYAENNKRMLQSIS